MSTLATQEFEAHRTHLRALAYRMTGSLSEAEDILQDAYIRWHKVNERVEKPRQYLTLVVARLCIDWMKSARVQRETYVGTWLPEPVTDSAAVTPATDAELAQDISVALMMALERLNPVERAAFLLRDVFDLEYAAISEVLGRKQPDCRKLAQRAREQVQGARQRYVPSPDETNRVLEAFAAALTGDLEPLSTVLAADAVLYTDGGGQVPATTRPIASRDRILKFVRGLVEKFIVEREVHSRPALVNGLPGAVLYDGDQVMQAMALDIQDGKLLAVYSVRNPAKLTQL